jgi:nucleoside-diphosphate-sugar epimerase
MKGRIIVLGGAGFIGYHLSFFLASKYFNNTIIIVDNFINSKMDDKLLTLLEFTNVSFVEGNLCDETFVSNLIQQDDFVINLAAFNGTSNFYNYPFSVLENSAVSAILVAKYCAIKGAEKYIYFGSSESYAGGVELGIIDVPTKEDVPLVTMDPRNPRWSYGSAKTIGEISCHSAHDQYSLNFIILRIHNIYGPRMGFNHVIPDLIRKFKSGDGSVTGLNETRSFLYVGDAVEIISQIIESKESLNLTINVGSDDEISIKELANKIKNLVNPNIVIFDAGRIAGSVIRRKPDLTLMKKFVNHKFKSLDEGLEEVLKDAFT